MATNQTNVKAIITAEDRASGALKGFGDNVANVGTKVAHVAKLAAEALAVAGAAAAGFAVASIKAYSDSEDRIAQTNAVLKSTGQVAGISARQVTALATALEKQTKFSDESVRSVENLLLTFTSIGKDIFPQATTTVLDMATALGEDTSSASIQLGKALQDPVLGVTALRRVGVNFNKAQQEVIKNLVDTGQSAKAQQLILKELNREFGGSAVAAGNTFSGSLAKLKNQLNNVQEVIGGVITKRLAPFITKALEAVAAINWDKGIARTINALRDFFGWLKQVYDQIQKVVVAVANYLDPKLTALWNTFNKKVIPILIRLWKEVLEPLIPVIGKILVVAIGFAIDALNLLLKVITPVINFMLNNKSVVIGLAIAFGTLALAMKFNAISTAFIGNMTAVKTSIGGVLSGVKNVISFLGGGVAAAGFAAFAAAAIAAFVLIKNKGNETLAVLQKLNDQVAQENAGDVKAMQNVINAYKAGKISKAAYQHFFQTLAPGAGVPARAGGGSVEAGQPYIVGERGQELFVPKQSGTIVPNNKMQSMGGANLNITVQAGAFMGSQIDARKYAAQILKALQDMAASKNTSVGNLLGVSP